MPKRPATRTTSAAEVKAFRAFFTRPVSAVVTGLENCLDSGVRGLLLIAAGLIAGWWLYVPVHELSHALACLATGGAVSRLEIDPLYGGALLERVFPFVAAGGDYAGRLSGFDTGGSDLVYLATDLGPFLWTLLPGVWALRVASRRRLPVAYGASLPFALAPFLSLTGDAYEIGSILTTWLPPWSGLEMLRGDDVFRLAPQLAQLDSAPWGGFVLAFMLGVIWALSTYACGRWIADRLDRRSFARGRTRFSARARRPGREG